MGLFEDHTALKIAKGQEEDYREAALDASRQVEAHKEIVVLKPEDCPFCSECSCSLNWQIEGPTADHCPKGRYPDYTFPDDCPLHKAIYIIKKGNQ